MYEDEICFLMVWLNTHDSCSSWRNNEANTDGAKLKMNYRTQKLGHYSSPTEPKHHIGHRLEDRARRSVALAAEHNLQQYCRCQAQSCRPNAHSSFELNN